MLRLICASPTRSALGGRKYRYIQISMCGYLFHRCPQHFPNSPDCWAGSTSVELATPPPMSHPFFPRHFTSQCPIRQMEFEWMECILVLPLSMPLLLNDSLFYTHLHPERPYTVHYHNRDTSSSTDTDLRISRLSDC